MEGGGGRLAWECKRISGEKRQPEILLHSQARGGFERDQMRDFCYLRNMTQITSEICILYFSR